MSATKLIIGSDTVPTKSNAELFASRNVQELIGNDLYARLAAAEYRVFNLETPLTSAHAPIKKCGPNFLAPEETVNGLKAMGIDLLTLANNHIMDQGEAGLRSTIKTLDEAGIAHLGAGATPEEAARPVILNCDGKKIGIYACAEHEFSIVSRKSVGANPFDPLESPDHVAALKAECDYVVVLYHGGKEYYRYPSPELQRVCRKLVEKGADLVVCQHSHCIGCEEKYRNGTIVYGQGNFLFDNSNKEFWKTSLLIEVDGRGGISYIPLVKKGRTVRLAAEEAEDILSQFYLRSEEIKADGAVEQKYAEFAGENFGKYLGVLSGCRKRLAFRVCKKLFGDRFVRWFIQRWYGEPGLLAVRNFVECEAHRELVLHALEKYTRSEGTE